MSKRKARHYEYTCRCSAYKHPHRFGGGRCRGIHIVEDHWQMYYGHGPDCENCMSLNKTDGTPYCEVIEGVENVDVCPVWQEFVASNEIRIYEDDAKFNDTYNQQRIL